MSGHRTNERLIITDFIEVDEQLGKVLVSYRIAPSFYPRTSIYELEEVVDYAQYSDRQQFVDPSFILDNETTLKETIDMMVMEMHYNELAISKARTIQQLNSKVIRLQQNR